MQKIFKSFDEAPTVLNAIELAQVLSIFRAGEYNLLNSKSFPTPRVGNHLLAAKTKVMKWIENNSSEGGAYAE